MLLEILLPGAVLAIAVVGLLVLLAVAGALYILSTRNSLLAQKNSVDRALFEVDILLKQQHDELPKLLGTCRSYMPREQKSLEALTDARAAYARAKTAEEKAQADEVTRNAVRALLTAAEKYPELRANSNFIQLRGRLAGLEDKVAAQRSRYNEHANAFNARIGRLPDKFIAGFLNLQSRPALPTPESDREQVQARPS